IYPATHYTMGGLWVDYDLMSTLPGLFVIGEANFSDHGANRLGASALMQGLADGYFIVPYTIGNFLAGVKPGGVATDPAEFRAAEAAVAERVGKLLAVRGRRTAMSFHRELGTIMWDHCGMSRTAESLAIALEKIPALREAFWQDLTVPGTGAELNQSLELAGRGADFLQLGELMCRGAPARAEAGGPHLRRGHPTAGGEAARH